MLLVTTTCLDDETVAEKMRRIATRMLCDEGLIEQAVHEAVQAFQHTHCVADALNAGIAFVSRVRASPVVTEVGSPDQTSLASWGSMDPAVRIILAACSLCLAALIAWGIA